MLTNYGGLKHDAKCASVRLCPSSFRPSGGAFHAKQNGHDSGLTWQ
jgi:hypothetical protein